MRGLRRQIIIGDAHDQLRRLPAESVDMVLTSPPYFRLRNYEIAGQLGAEEHVDQWVSALRDVALQAHRVLVPTGSLWLNLGDTYASHRRQGAPPKSLVLGPERLALTLLRDGWLLRNKVIWHKSNHLPSSIRDRLTSSWEVIYVFTKAPRYFFDLDSIRVPHTGASTYKRNPRYEQPHDRELWWGPNGSTASGLTQLKARGIVGHPLGKNPGDVWTLAASNYRGAHHATFPINLAERAILAGCPEARCLACRLPWKRQLIRSVGGTAVRGALAPTCGCDAASEPGLVLDPFFGAGTTAVAAERLSRGWLGIELNPDFAALAEQRIQDARAGPAGRAA